MVDKFNKKSLKYGFTVPNYLHKEEYVRYYGDSSIKVTFSKKDKRWKDSEYVVLEPRKDFFDFHPLTIMGAVLTVEGIMVFYDSSWYAEGIFNFRVGMAIFDEDNPKKLIYRNELPLYQHEFKIDKIVVPNEATQFGEELLLSWNVGKSGVVEVKIPHPYIYLEEGNKSKLRKKIKKQLQINRHQNNPIIEPLSENDWESKATFNPAALHVGEKVHLLYRAIGEGDMSVLGYIASDDGFDFNERLKHPVYFSRKQDKNFWGLRRFRKSPISYVSGGSWNGGCEDPRLTLVDDVIYLTYTAFDGWGSLRMALSSISLKDFLNKEWNWKEPVMISPPNEINKNWVVFPEKINGKFAVLHSINPDISIDYLNDLEFNGEDKYIKSPFSMVKNKGRWDSWVRGVGPPPLKTKKGWLIIYHAMDFYNDPNRYKIGAMLLDLDDPQKIIARSKEPILEPDEHYENNGHKAGVAYCCGAVEKDEQLLIYYGGADTVSCVAEINLNEFVDALIETEKPKIITKKNKNLKKSKI